MKRVLGPYAFLPDQFEFMIWGDRLMLEAALKVPEEGYYREAGISMGSLHKVLVHAMGAQWVWLRRFQGEISPRRLDETDCPTREELAKRWPGMHEELRSFVAEQTLESLSRTLAYKNLRGDPQTGVLGQLLMHVVDHGTYHRGQQNTLVKMAGGTPVNAMYVSWRQAHPVVEE